MLRYLFFPPADAAQDEIWTYTVDKYGSVQAIEYIEGLHHYLQRLADKKKHWRYLPHKWVVSNDLEVQVFFSKYEHHYIFFREFPSSRIGIMSILHDKMDIPLRLKEDIEQIMRENL